MTVEMQRRLHDGSAQILHDQPLPAGLGPSSARLAAAEVVSDSSEPRYSARVLSRSSGLEATNATTLSVGKLSPSGCCPEWVRRGAVEHERRLDEAEVRLRSPVSNLAGDVATWPLAPDRALDPKTTSLVVEVTRLGCASGITGTVLDPQIQYDETQVLLRTGIVEKIGLGTHDCQGNDAVPVEIHLDQSLGVRTGRRRLPPRRGHGYRRVHRSSAPRRRRPDGATAECRTTATARVLLRRPELLRGASLHRRVRSQCWRRPSLASIR